jgi:hypothetical protein
MNDSPCCRASLRSWTIWAMNRPAQDSRNNMAVTLPNE